MLRGRKPKEPEQPVGRRRVQLDRPQAPQAFSYYAQRSASQENVGRRTQPERPREALLRHGRSLAANRFLFALAALMCLILVGFWLRLSTQPTIIALQDTNSTYFIHSQAEYQEAAHNILASSWKNQNKITFDTSQFASDLKHQFPELDTVIVTTPLIGGRPQVFVASIRPTLLLVNASGSYIIGADGKALADSTSVSNLAALKLPVVHDESGVPIKLNQIAFPVNQLQATSEIIDQVQAKGLSIDSFTLPKQTVELDMRLKAQPYVVKFNIESSDMAREQVGAFLALKDYLANKKVTPASYIDVRVEGRAYYK